MIQNLIFMSAVFMGFIDDVILLFSMAVKYVKKIKTAEHGGGKFDGRCLRMIWNDS